MENFTKGPIMYYKIWMDNLDSGFSGFLDNRVFLSLEEVEKQINAEIETKQGMTFLSPFEVESSDDRAKNSL